jgi:hypothetical protein
MEGGVPGLGPRVGEAQERGEREGTRPRPDTEKKEREVRKREGKDPPLRAFLRRGMKARGQGQGERREKSCKGCACDQNFEEGYSAREKQNKEGMGGAWHHGPAMFEKEGEKGRRGGSVSLGFAKRREREGVQMGGGHMAPAIRVKREEEE